MNVSAVCSALRRGAIASAAVAVMGFTTNASALVQTFTSLPGSTLDGFPVSAEAKFTTSAGQIQLILTNLISNPTSIIQAISDIFFVATTGGTVETGGTGFKVPTAQLISIADDGSFTNVGGSASWLLSNSGGTYHLDVLAGGATGPATLIIGPDSGGVYSNANGSIAGNPAHNPFIDTTATFTFAIATVTDQTVISDVVFSFGTEPGRNVGIPIPAAVWLFGSGLLGLIAIARRRHGAASTAVPVPA